MHRLITLTLGLAVALAAAAAGRTPAAGAASRTGSPPGGPARAPGTPGYRLPWNRPTRDTVVDLANGERADRFEFRARLIADDDRPLAGALVYVYHADGHGLYGSQEYPTIPTMAGSVRTGPGGGFIVRSTVPGMVEGPPHVHLEVALPGRGRCVWFVNLRPDSATGPLPNSMNLAIAGSSNADNEHHAIVHLDPDGVYRARRSMHTAAWFAQPGLDSLHTAAERRYERAPWRSAGKARGN